MPKPKPPKPSSRAWVFILDEHHIYCYKSSADTQHVCSFVEAKTLTPFHDASLERCTKKLNAIIATLQKGQTDRDRSLALLSTPRGMFLAWTKYGVVGPDDDEAEVEKALGIR